MQLGLIAAFQLDLIDALTCSHLPLRAHVSLHSTLAPEILKSPRGEIDYSDPELLCVNCQFFLPYNFLHLHMNNENAVGSQRDVSVTLKYSLFRQA